MEGGFQVTQSKHSRLFLHWTLLIAPGQNAWTRKHKQNGRKDQTTKYHWNNIAFPVGFFFLFSLQYPSLDLGWSNTQKWRLAQTQFWKKPSSSGSRSKTVGSRCSEGGETLVFSLCRCQGGHSDCAGNGGLLHENLEEGNLSLWSEGLWS